MSVTRIVNMVILKGTNKKLNEIERAAEQAVEDAVKYADESELPDVDSLHEDVFA